MAKLLPFVSNNAPIQEMADRICQRYSSLPLASKLQLLNIIRSEGLENVEKAIKDVGDGPNLELIVFREFYYVPTIPSNTLLVAKYFIEYVDQVYPDQSYWCIPLVFPDALILHLAILFFYPVAFTGLSKNGFIPVVFEQKHYLKDIATKKYFSSDTKAKVREFCSQEQLEAYLLLAEAEPTKMFETLNNEKEPIFTKPVRAVLKSEE